MEDLILFTITYLGTLAVIWVVWSLARWLFEPDSSVM
jgi:hypothetical protein